MFWRDALTLEVPKHATYGLLCCLPARAMLSIDGPSIREWEGLCIQSCDLLCFVMLLPVIVSLSRSTYHAVHILVMQSWPGGISLRM